ncbi:MAG: tetratricopeptide repeat protein [Candidatus Muiribacteriota bacterium]
MKKTLLVFFLTAFFILVSEAQIPDIDELWKKHGQPRPEEENKTKSQMETAFDYVENKDYDRALKIYEKLLNKNTDSSHLHNAIGYCFEKMGELENAYMFYSAATKLTPVDPDSYNNLAFLHAQKGKESEEILEGLDIIEKALKYSPDNHNYLKTRLHILEKAEKKELWKEYAIEFLEEFPNINEINYKVGKYFFNKKDYLNAKKYLNKALPEKEAVNLLAEISEDSVEGYDEELNQVNKKIQKKAKNNFEEMKRKFEKDYMLNLREVENKLVKDSEETQKSSQNNILDDFRVGIDTSGPRIDNLRVSKETGVFDKGVSNYQRGYFDNALKHFSNFIEREERNKNYSQKLSQAYKYKSLIYTHQNKLDEELWEKIEFIDENVYIEKIIKLMENNQKNELRQLLIQMMRAETFSNIKEFISMRLSYIDGYLSAKKEFEEYAQIDFYIPENSLKNFDSEAKKHFEKGYKRIIEERVSAAEKYFKMAVNRAPSHYVAQYNLGVLNIKLGNYEEGIYHIDKARRYAPFSDEMYFMIRRLYNQLILYI